MKITDKMHWLIRLALVGVLTVFVAGFAVPPSSYADIIRFDLTSDHCTGTCLTGQTRAGYIEVSDVSAGVVDLKLVLENNNKLIVTGVGNPYAMVFNLFGNPTITYSNLVGFSLVGFGPGPPTIPNPQSASSLGFDGVGTLEYGLGCGLCTGIGGGSGAPVGSTFTVRISGAGLSTASFGELNSPQGQAFGVDILSGTTGFTGAVDAGGGTPVPEPSTVALYALGFLMLVAGQQWRKGRTSRVRIEAL